MNEDSILTKEKFTKYEEFTKYEQLKVSLEHAREMMEYWMNEVAYLEQEIANE